MGNGNFQAFLESLGAFESGIDTTQTYPDSWFTYLNVFDPEKGNVDPSSVDTHNPADLAQLQYHVHNTIGFLGKYQFGEPLLIDLGYYTPAASGFYGSTATNEWKGTWTGKNGVHSKEDFMSEVQELAIREAFAMNMGVIDTYLSQAGKTLDDFLGNEFTYTQNGAENTAVVTMSGILASAHLQGPGGVAQLLLNGTVSHDEYGTNILSYMDKFGGFNNPFGSAADDFLSGSDYNETFSGEAGHNIYETGDGHDKIIITENAGGSDTITDFDVTKDVISLADFTGLTFGDLLIHDNGTGDAVITLPNNQTITLEGVNSSTVNESLFVKGPIILSWNANSGDTVIQNFNLTHDLIDLNYAFGVNNLSLYEENGSAVIEVLGNNQRLILEDVSLDDLAPFHFLKAPIEFADAFFSDNAPTNDPSEGGDETAPPPVVDDPPADDPVSDDTPPDNTPTDPNTSDTVYSYTWNWGSHEVLNQFDVSNDVIDLQSFWTSFDAIDLYNDTDGNAVIDLTTINNQTITLNGVSVDALGNQHFSGINGSISLEGTTNDNDPPPDDPTIEDPVVENPPTETNNGGDVHSFTWGWGSHTVIHNFDANQDVVDLQGFWTQYNAFSIYETSQGDTTIDLSDLNNQTITLTGVSLDSFGENNMSGVNGSYADALNDATVNDTPPTDSPDPSAPDDGDGGNETSEESPTNDDAEVFAFTWAWGSQDIVEGFDPSNDTIDLHSFWTTPDQVDIYNNSEGNAVIDLTALNNQTITVIGVSADQLDDAVGF